MPELVSKAEVQNPRSFRAWISGNRVPVFLVLIAVFFSSAVTILHEDAISPIDELVYLDYAFKVDDQGLVREGETFGDEVAYVAACKKAVPFGDLGQECSESARVDLERMPNGGYTTAHAYPPVYFWITRLIGDPIHAVTGLSEVTSWRLTGVLWLSAGLLVMVGLFRKWSVPEPVIFAVGLVFIASPFAWWTYTYLSTDISLFLIGGLTLLVTTDVIKGKQRGWWLVLIAAAGVLFKITNLLVLGLALLILLIHKIAERIGQKKAHNTPGGSYAEGALGLSVAPARWVPMVVAVAVAVGLQFAWMRIFPLFAVSTATVDQGVNTSLGGTEIVRLAVSTLTGAILHNPANGFMPDAPFGALYAPLGWLVAAGVVGAMMSFKWKLETGPLIWSVGIASVITLPMLAILMYATTGAYFQLPARYAAGLLPAFLLILALMLRNHAMRIVVLVFAALSIVTGLLLAYEVGARF